MHSTSTGSGDNEKAPQEEDSILSPRHKKRRLLLLGLVVVVLAGIAVGGWAIHKFVVEPNGVDPHMAKLQEGNLTAGDGSWTGGAGGYSPNAGIWAKKEMGVNKREETLLGPRLVSSNG
ncbi:hypothetical protein L204_103135 [Cryptococcus depauperatus]|nr:hypothetical protein L204_00119 [Cryptococcus depauperatus CBS 7855]